MENVDESVQKTLLYKAIISSTHYFYVWCLCDCTISKKKNIQAICWIHWMCACVHVKWRKCNKCLQIILSSQCMQLHVTLNSLVFRFMLWPNSSFTCYLFKMWQIRLYFATEHIHAHAIPFTYKYVPYYFWVCLCSFIISIYLSVASKPSP